VNRYKGSPALESYQLENEFLLPGFSSKCTDFNRDRLITEYNLVKQLDPYHKLVISRSNNVFGLPIGDPVPDEYAIAVYKRVWEAVILKRYIQEPYPAWYYAFLAGAQKIMTGKNMFIHELQTEAWPPNHQSITDTSLEEQNKSFDAERMRDTIKFGEATDVIMCFDH